LPIHNIQLIPSQVQNIIEKDWLDPYPLVLCHSQFVAGQYNVQLSLIVAPAKCRPIHVYLFIIVKEFILCISAKLHNKRKVVICRENNWGY